MEKQTSIDILYQMAIDRLNAQIHRIDGIDSKIGITFGLTNAITATLVAFMAFATNPSEPFSKLVLSFLILTILSYVITLAILFFAYHHGMWSFRPEMKTLQDICINPKYHDYSPIIKEWVADECIDSISYNRDRIIKKAKLADKALITLSAQVLFLVISFISHLFC